MGAKPLTYKTEVHTSDDFIKSILRSLKINDNCFIIDIPTRSSYDCIVD